MDASWKLSPQPSNLLAMMIMDGAEISQHDISAEVRDSARGISSRRACMHESVGDDGNYLGPVVDCTDSMSRRHPAELWHQLRAGKRAGSSKTKEGSNEDQDVTRSTTSEERLGNADQSREESLVGRPSLSEFSRSVWLS